MLVSGLIFISKLVERVVAAQVTNHICTNELGMLYQSAYHSTETALLHTKNDVKSSLSKDVPSALILLDLSPAFGTIDHATFLGRLRHMHGILRVALKWFVSYLSNRCQSIMIHSIVPVLSTLKYGVLQGSVLGPILFSMFIAPLEKIISAFKSLKYHFYADDTEFYCHNTMDDVKTTFSHL